MWRIFGEMLQIFLFVYFLRFRWGEKCAVLIAKQLGGPGRGEQDFVLSGERGSRGVLAGWPHFERVMASWQVGCI
jgi:hypothetical protein